MHGSTKQMVDHLVAALVERGVAVEPFDLTVVDLGKLAAALVDGATIVVGTPTVLAGAHPLALHAAYLAQALRPKARFGSVIGSYGWGGKTVEQLAEIIAPLKLEILPPVTCKGLPKTADLEALDALAAAIAEKHQGLQSV
jgi:flavorubredoxin